MLLFKYSFQLSGKVSSMKSFHLCSSIKNNFVQTFSMSTNESSTEYRN